MIKTFVGLAVAYVAMSSGFANAMPLVDLEAVQGSPKVIDVTYPCGPGYHMTEHGYCARWQYLDHRPPPPPGWGPYRRPPSPGWGRPRDPSVTIKIQ